MPSVEGFLDERGVVQLKRELWPESGVLGAYPRWSSRTTDATMLYHLASGIVVFAHLVNRYGLRNHYGKPFRFQHMMIGKSGASKSTAWSRALDTYEAVCGRLGISPTPGNLTIAGSLPGLFEALGDMREPDTDWHYGILYHDEVSTFLRNTRHEAVPEFLCMLADGTKYERHLRYVKAQNRLAAGSAVESIAHHAFQGLYLTTFDVLRMIARPEYVNGGAFSRWTWFVGPDLPHHEKSYELRLDEREAVIESFVDLLQWLSGQSLLYQQRQQPFQVTIDKTIRDEVIEPMYQELLVETSDAMVPILKRGLELTTQYASLFAISERRMHTSREDYERAANFVALSLDGYRRLLPRIGASGGSPMDIARSKIDDAFNAIRNAGPKGLSRSELHRVLSRPGKQVIDELVSTLVDEGMIEERAAKQPNGGRGRPSVHYVALAKKRAV